jgi:hypothetical protein
VPKSIIACNLLFALTVQATTRADIVGPFRDFREVDSTGRYYVVVRKDKNGAKSGLGVPVEFAIAERKAGSPPVMPALDTYRTESGALVAKNNPDVRVREGDILLGHGKLDDCNGGVLVSSAGLGFVGLNQVYHHFGKLLGDKGRKANVAIPDLIRLMEGETETKAGLRRRRYAARALGRIGPDAQAALPALIRLAQEHAADEWDKWKGGQPELRKDVFGDATYFQDEFVDANKCSGSARDRTLRTGIEDGLDRQLRRDTHR